MQFLIDLNYPPRELALISDSEIFVSLNAPVGTSKAGYKMKIEFNTHSIIWKYKFISTMNNDVQLISSWLYSSSNNMIYSLTVFGGSQSAVLFILNSLSGSLAHSPLKLSTPIYQSSGIIFVDNIIYFTTYSPINSYLVVLNTQSYSSTVYTFSGLNIYRIGITFDSSRYVGNCFIIINT